MEHRQVRYLVGGSCEPEFRIFQTVAVIVELVLCCIEVVQLRFNSVHSGSSGARKPHSMSSSSGQRVVLAPARASSASNS
jgi:hypothetical protein